MQRLSIFIRRRVRTRIRPWTMVTPVAVLLVCLPLLRPLRHPEATAISDDENARLATIDAIVENPTAQDEPLAARLAIDSDWLTTVHHTIRRQGRHFSPQPPVFAFVMAAPYDLMHRMGWRLRDNSVLVPYVLTLIGSTLPAVAAAGLIYRLGRLFELKRTWRVFLSAAAVFGSGLISYAVVLSPHVAAAALVLAASACLAQVAVSPNPSRGGGWLAAAGLSAGAAGVIDLPALIFLPMFPAIILAMRLRPSLKLAAVLLFIVGATPPLLLHFVLTAPITGDLRPGIFHPELADHRWTSQSMRNSEWAIGPSAADETAGDDEVPNQSMASRVAAAMGAGIAAVAATLLGRHGLLFNFPVVLIASAGIAAVMHRNWPMTTKTLAVISAVGALVTMIVWMIVAPDPTPAMFANQWFIVFLPLLLLWLGAWLRRPHRRGVWGLFAGLLGLSVLSSLIGAINPLPRDEPDDLIARPALPSATMLTTIAPPNVSR
jgi:hypothetical protein